jgi:copper(I)-binding protein
VGIRSILDRRKAFTMTLTRALAAAACAVALAPAALAAGLSIRIEHPWSRPTPPSAPTAVGYLTIVNTSNRADRLMAAESPAAETVQAHAMTMDGGIMRMRPVQGGLPIPAGGSVTLGPDGDHLMFIHLKRPFVAGDHVPVTLVFEHAGRKRVELMVEGDGKPAPDMKGMNMN